MKMEEIIVPEVGSIKFDPDLLISGVDFSWSGYCKTKEVFVSSNFISQIEDGHSVMICSEDNMPGICDYLFNYVIESAPLSELLFFVSPDMDYSCFLAWEQRNPLYGDCYVLDDIVHCFIDGGLIHSFQVKDKTIFVLIDFECYEHGHYSNKIQEDIDEYCVEELLVVLDKRLYGEGITSADREEDIDFLLSDGRDWLIKPISIVREKHERRIEEKEEELWK